MAINIDREKLDEFCSRLFRVLDNQGLLPRSLGWRRDASGKLRKIAPTEFEKYPRLLFGVIQRYNDAEAGFREWESRVLRAVKSPNVREEHHPELTELRRWVVDNKEVFDKGANVQHLRTSLFARVFDYLFPRRALANAYCNAHKGAPRAIEPEFLERKLPDSIEADVQNLRRVYSDEEWKAIVADTRSSLIANAAYYRMVLGAEESVTLSAEEVEEVEEQLEIGDENE